MKFKSLILGIIAIVAISIGLNYLPVIAQTRLGDGNINTLDQWKTDGTNITQRTASKPVKLTGFTSLPCLGTDSSGIIGAGTCTGGGGGSSILATTTDAYFISTNGTTYTAYNPMNGYTDTNDTSFVTTWNKVITNSGTASTTIVLGKGNFLATTTVKIAKNNVAVYGQGEGITTITATATSTGNTDLDSAYLFGVDPSQIASAYNLTADAVAGDLTLTVSPSDSTHFPVGTTFNLYSTLSVDTEFNSHNQGELHQVIAVNTTTGVITIGQANNGTHVFQTTTMANSAKLVPLVFYENFTVSGITFTDNATSRPNTLLTGQVLFRFARNVTIDHVQFKNMFHSAIMLWQTMGVKIENSDFLNIKDVTPSANTFYGVDIHGGAINTDVIGNTFNNMRHAVTQGAGTTAYYAGITRSLSVSGNTSTATYTAHFDVHQGAIGVSFVNNTMVGDDGSANGIQCRSICSITGNSIIGVLGDGILIFGGGSGSTITGNDIEGAKDGIFITNNAHNVSMTGNSISGGINGVTLSPVSATVTISIASPAVVTYSAHGITAGGQVTFTTTGALPTGITAGTVYYIITPITTSTFGISLTQNGAAVNTSGTQSGVQTIHYNSGDESTIVGGQILSNSGSGISADGQEGVKVSDVVFRNNAIPLSVSNTAGTAKNWSVNSNTYANNTSNNPTLPATGLLNYGNYNGDTASAGYFGIGTSQPLYPVHIITPQSANSGTVVGTRNQTSFTPTGASYTTDVEGAYDYLEVNTGTAVDSNAAAVARARYAQAINFSNKSINSLYAVTGETALGFGSTGSINSAYGIHGDVINNGAVGGSIANAFAVFSECRSTGQSTLGTCVGFYGDASYTSGRFTNYIGLALPSHTNVASSSISGYAMDNFGFGTTSPGSPVAIGLTGGINFYPTATSTWGSSAAGINLTKGCFAIGGVCIGSGGSLTGTTGQVAYFSGTNTAIGTSTIFITPAGNIGIGTIAPTEVNANARLTVAGISSQDIIASTTDNTTLSDAIIQSMAPGSRVFLGAHGTNQITTQYGITVGGWAEIGAINSSFGTSNGLLIGTRTTATPIVFGTNSAERMRITSTGNVAIGTTTPTYPLTAFSATTPQLALSAGTGLPQWTIANEGGNFYMSTTTVAGTATTSPSIFTILNTGNIGIGTSTPLATLHIIQNGTTNGVLVQGNSTFSYRSVNPIGTTMFSVAGSNGDVTSAGTIQTATGFRATAFGAYMGILSGNRFVFNNGNIQAMSSTNSEVARFTDTNFGVGTSSPWKTFSVAGDAIFDSIFLGSTTGSSMGNNNLIQSGASSAFLNLKGGAGRAKISIGNDSTTIVGGNSSGFVAINTGASASTNAGTEVFRATGSSVGIGSTTPWRTLDINGTMAINGLGSGTSKDAVCIDATTKEVVDAGATTCLSSSKYLKDETGEITPEVAKYIVEHMRAITFKYKWQDNEHYGFIAEEVAKIDSDVKEKFGVKAQLAEYATADFTNQDTGHVFKKGEPYAVDYQMYTAVLTVYMQNSGTVPVKNNNTIYFLMIGALALYIGYNEYDKRK